MKYTEALGKAKKLFEDAKAIMTNPEASAEDMAKVEGMIEDAKAMKATAVKLQDLEKSAAELGDWVDQVRDETPPASPEPVGAEFKSVGDLLQAISVWAKFNQRDERLKWYDDGAGRVLGNVKALAEAVGADGGFLVPTEFIATLYSVLAERSFVRPRATIIPMRRRQISMPVLDQTGTTSGIPHWFGGMQFYWAEEAASKTETTAQFRELNLVAHKLIGYTRASDELLADSAISLEAFLMGDLGFVGGANWMEEYSFLRGTGAGQPLGIINAGATITVARAADNAISYADLCNMVECLLPSSNAVWMISQSAVSDMLQLSGPTGNPSYIWGNAVSGQPASLLGFPVIWTEKCPRIGTAGDVVLADWRYYLIGDRQAATVESTQFDRWQYDQTSWRMVHRVDGQPWMSQPFIILGGKST